MNRNSDRSDHFVRLFIAATWPVPKPRVVSASALRRETGPAHAVHSRSPHDAILKSLHRDSPLRHTYLRKRWQAF